MADASATVTLKVRRFFIGNYGVAIIQGPRRYISLCIFAHGHYWSVPKLLYRWLKAPCPTDESATP